MQNNKNEVKKNPRKHKKNFYAETFLYNVIFYQTLIYVFENFLRSPLRRQYQTKEWC